MYKQFLIVLICLVSFTNAFSQDSVAVKEVKKPSLDHGSIQSQFNYLLKVSTTYQEYKVIKITSFHKFKNNISDSLQVAYKQINNSNKEILAQKSSIDNLQGEVDNLKVELAEVNKEKDSIALLGIPMSKGAYKSMMWGIVLILVVLAVGAILLFKRSNSVTKSTKVELEEVKEEFETHRKRALKREQELAVKYHNEINKLKQNLI